MASSLSGSGQLRTDARGQSFATGRGLGAPRRGQDGEGLFPPPAAFFRLLSWRSQVSVGPAASGVLAFPSSPFALISQLNCLHISFSLRLWLWGKPD